MTTATELWFPLPEELYQRARETLAGRDDELVMKAFASPALFGKELYKYWKNRKHSYGLREVLSLLEPSSLAEGSRAGDELAEIKHTLRVESLIWKWLEWTEADFVIPERYKGAFRERFPEASARWCEYLENNERSFGQLLEGTAISFRGFREWPKDLGYEYSPGAKRAVLGEIDYLVELWKELWHEHFELWRAASIVRDNFEFLG